MITKEIYLCHTISSLSKAKNSAISKNQRLFFIIFKFLIKNLNLFFKAVLLNNKKSLLEKT